MAMNCTGVLYFPITISVLEGIALELIEARFGLKGVAAFIKLLCKVYKEEGYYMSWVILRGNTGNYRTID